MNEKRIHFIGICGVAMSALALAFKKQGWIVTGSDVGFYPPISTYLTENKVDYYPGWHPDRVLHSFSEEGKNDFQVVVVGNVASSQNPEWLYVKEHNLNYKSYPEVIRDFFIKKNSIVCAGTYGKSTSTTLLTWILKEANFDPSYMFGSLSQNDMPAAKLTKSDWSVVEGDEYKASRWDSGPKFAYYSPTHLLLTATVWDHADVYPTETEYMNAFRKLVAMVPQHGCIIAGQAAKDIMYPLSSIDNKRYEIEDRIKIRTYGISSSSDYYYSNIAPSETGQEFDIAHEGTTYHISTSCLGDYMADNITGCFAMAHTIGIEPDKIIDAINSFKGMKRRLEKRYEGATTIFDDIAHSPTKAKSALEALKKTYPSKKIYAVFEPNTGNRRPQAKAWYDNAFSAADEIIIPRLTKVKLTEEEEPPFEGNELRDIIAHTHPKVSYIDEDQKLIDYIINSTNAGDVVIFLGSHGFRGMIEEMVKRVK